MAYFLKKTKQQNRTYLAIYESLFSPEVRGTKHRCFKSLGNMETIKANGIADPISYYSDEVKKLNEQRKAEQINLKLNQKQISDVSPERFLGYFPLANILNTLDVEEHFGYMQSTRDFHFNVYNIFSSLVFARAVSPLSKHKTFHDILPSLFKPVDFSYDQLLDAVEFIGSEYEKFVEIFTAATKENFGIETKHTYSDCTNFQFKVLKNRYSSNDICTFIKEFRLVKINENRYINMTRASEFITNLAITTGHPITNYYLTERQIKIMHTR